MHGMAKPILSMCAGGFKGTQTGFNAGFNEMQNFLLWAGFCDIVWECVDEM